MIERLTQISFDEISISAITVAELEYGARKSSAPDKNREALSEFLAPFTVLSFDQNATNEYGIIRSVLEQKRLPIGSLDTLIAAHAKSLNLTLVTNNEREFSRIEGLTVENWVKE